MTSLPSHITHPTEPHAAPYPSVAAVVERLRRAFGDEGSVGPSTLRWWVDGQVKEMGMAVVFDTVALPVDQPSVIWVTRPGEAQTERCPIVSMKHLESFLTLVSIARHTAGPVHGHVCPGED